MDIDNNTNRDKFVQLMKEVYRKNGKISLENLFEPPFTDINHTESTPLFTKEELVELLDAFRSSKHDQILKGSMEKSKNGGG